MHIPHIPNNKIPDTTLTTPFVLSILVDNFPKITDLKTEQIDVNHRVGCKY